MFKANRSETDIHSYSNRVHIISLYIGICRFISSISYTLFNQPYRSHWLTHMLPIHTENNQIQSCKSRTFVFLSVLPVSQNEARFPLDQTKAYCLWETTSGSRHKTPVLHTSLNLGYCDRLRFPLQWQLDFTFHLQKAVWKLAPLFQVQNLIWDPPRLLIGFGQWWKDFGTVPNLEIWKIYSQYTGFQKIESKHLRPHKQPH